MLQKNITKLNLLIISYGLSLNHEVRVTQCFLAEVLLLTWSYDTTPVYNVVEFFSGKAEVSAAFREAGYAVGSYDYLYNQRGMDFLSPGGFGLGTQ